MWQNSVLHGWCSKVSLFLHRLSYVVWICFLHFLSAAMHVSELSYFAVAEQLCKFTFVLPVLKNRSRGLTMYNLVLWVVLLCVLCHGLCVCVCDDTVVCCMWLTGAGIWMTSQDLLKQESITVNLSLHLPSQVLPSETKLPCCWKSQRDRKHACRYQ
jgi:hypothetical protein